MAILHRTRECFQIHYRTARIIHENGAWLHGANRGFPDHAHGLSGFGHMHRDRIRFSKQRMQAWHGLRIAMRQLGRVIVIDHPHAKGFREHRKLRTDIAIADNAKRLAAHFPAIGRRFIPFPAMRRIGFREDAAHHHNDFAERQFRNRPRIGKRCIENRNAARSRRFQGHLVGADAKAANRDQPVRRRQHFFRHLGARPYAQHMHALQRARQHRAIQRLGFAFHGTIASIGQQLDSAIGDTLKQQDLDLVLGEREAGGAHGRRFLRLIRPGFKGKSAPRGLALAVIASCDALWRCNISLLPGIEDGFRCPLRMGQSGHTLAAPDHGHRLDRGLLLFHRAR